MIQDNIEMNQLQIGKDMMVELQIPPSTYLNFRDNEKILRLGRGEILWDAVGYTAKVWDICCQVAYRNGTLSDPQFHSK